MDRTGAQHATGRPAPKAGSALLGALALSLALTAPALPESLAAERQAELEESVRELGLDPAEILFPSRLTPEMRAWVRERVAASGDPRERLDQLLAALVDADDLGLRYDSSITGTAREVFETRQANCLSFTSLFLGMSREIGLDTYFLEILRPPSFDKEGDLVVVWEHVTAGYGPPARRVVLEFSVGPSGAVERSRRLSDLTGLAMFYSNRGAEALRAGDDAAALEWLEVAVRLDSGWPQALLNLGVARRRLGDLEGAEKAYREVLSTDPEQLQAYFNLSSLLRLQGDRDAAGKMLRLLDRRDNIDPYMHLALGDASFEQKRLDDTHRFYKRAYRLAPDLADTRAALGRWALETGNLKQARKWLARARRADAEARRTVELAAALEEASRATGTMAASEKGGVS